VILGVSHVMCSSADVERDTVELGALGYERKFSEVRLPNFAGKNKFLSRDYTEHSLFFHQHPAGIGVEIVQYPETAERTTPVVEVLFKNSVPPYAKALPAGSGLGNILMGCGLAAEPIECELDQSGKHAWFDLQASSSAGCKAIVFHTAEFEAAAEWWKICIGAKADKSGVTDGRRWQNLMVMRNVPSWCAAIVLLEDAPRTTDFTLDTPGFTCLSFLTSSLQRERESFLKHGAKASSGVFRAPVGGRALDAEIFRAPGPSFIELIQIS
jgi:hypothetical protein